MDGKDGPDAALGVLRASSNPVLRLMGIAPELRDNIFRHLLLSHKEIYLSFDRPSHWRNAEHFESTTRLYRGVRPDERASIAVGDREVCQTIDPAILRVSKQACREGRKILYGENRWLFTNARALKSFLLDYLDVPRGFRKEALITDLTFWPQFKYDQSTSEIADNNFIDFIDLVCNQMPVLRHFRVVFHYPVFSDNRYWIHMPGHSHIIVVLAAGITQRHPYLKKAVLSGLSGRVRLVEDCSPSPSQFEVVWIVDIVAAGPTMDFEPMDAIVSSWFPKIEDLESEWLVANDVTLDCPRIRATPREDICDMSPTQFALPDTATSSEPTEALETMSEAFGAIGHVDM